MVIMLNLVIAMGRDRLNAVQRRISFVIKTV